MVKFITIKKDSAGQRIDNFLFTMLKGVPKSRIYRGLRKGEFRVNRGRVSADYRLNADDCLRIPPIRLGEPRELGRAPSQWIERLESQILYEDEQLIVINKPSGIPVHGGSQISWGVIELLRTMRPQDVVLELVHRLDQETSGCLLIAKKRTVLLEWHHLLTHRQVKKQYTLLVQGQWDPKKKIVNLPLRKNMLQGGERIVRVDADGKAAETHFQILQSFKNATLLSATLVTGRTHQLRVHTAAMGHPIAGDEKYGDKVFNREMRQKGLKRLFLHCSLMEKSYKTDTGFQGITAPLDETLSAILNLL